MTKPTFLWCVAMALYLPFTAFAQPTQDTITATGLLHYAYTLKNDGNYEQAFVKANEAEKQYLNNTVEPDTLLAAIQYLKGVLQYNLSDYENAVKDLNQSLLIYQKYNNHGRMADCHLWIGNARWYLVGSEKALPDFEKAVAKAKQDSKKTGNYKGKYYLDRGYVKLELNEFAAARADMEYALALDTAYYGAVSTQVAEDYGMLANYFRYIEDYFQSLKNYQQEEKIYSQIYINNDHINIGSLYGNMGRLSFNMSNMTQALAYYHKSLAIFQKYLRPNHPNIAILYSTIGITYHNMKEHERSLENYNAAAAILDTADVSTTIAVQQGLAFCYQGMGQYARARKIFEAMLPQAIAFFGEQTNQTALCYEHLAENSLYLEGKEKESRNYSDKALAIYRHIYPADHPSIARIHSTVMFSFLPTNNVDSILYYYDMGMDVLNNNMNNYAAISSPDIWLGLQYTKGLCLSKTQNASYWKEALQLYLKIDDYLQYLKSHYESEAAKRLLNEDYNVMNAQIIELCSKLYKIDKDEGLKQTAFKYAEKAKSALLLEAMKKARIPILDTLQQNIQVLETNIAYYDKKIYWEETKKDADIKAINEWRGLLFDLKQDLQNVIKTAQAHPDLLKVIYEVNDTLSIQTIQQQLLQADQSLVEYAIGDSSLFIFLIQPNYYEVQEVKIDTFFQKWIREMTQEGIYGYHTSTQKSTPLKERTLNNYTEAASRLYEKLIAPIQSKLTKEVIIVPDGVLGYVPFEALLKKKPTKLLDFKSYQYLLQDHQISYSYSATLLKEMRDKKHRQQPSGKLLAFAPFYLGNPDTLVVHLDTIELFLALKDSLKTLEASGAEVKTIAKRMHGDDWYGEQASMQKFQDVAAQYRILHLSTHGKADDRVGDYAYLAFCMPDAAGEFTKLYARDLYNLSLNADLVVLSACETGIGKLQRGEGIVSLARAFAYAGAKSVVTTLWKVDDTATKDVVVAFYKYLKKGRTKDEALRLAKLEFLKKNADKPERMHPFFWAGMIGIGDMRAID